MPVTHVHTFLVTPSKGLPEIPIISGASLPLTGKMYDLLKSVYERSEDECSIDISFNRSGSGEQSNPCRTLVLNYLAEPTVEKAKGIAQRLSQSTTNRSRLGLLFVVNGVEGLDRKVVLSRFPADSGIMAEQNADGLSVEFLERIFMKSAKSYKAVVYKHSSLTSGFWKGKAVDRQINAAESDISNYWIADFLDSDFLTTAASGTRRMAIALRNATKETPDLRIKSEITAAALLATSLDGQRLSANDFCRRVPLSAGAKEAILEHLQPSVIDEKFQFSSRELERHIAYKSIELDNGAVLTAETSSFDQVFHRESADEKEIKFSTTGKITNEKFRKVP